MKKGYQVIKCEDRSITLLPEKCYFSLIWLHGLGDTSEGFLDYFQMKQSPLYKGGKIILLQAPVREVTINEGDACNSWYDIKAEVGTDEEKYSIEEIKESLQIIDRIVCKEIEFWKEKGMQEDEEILCKRIFVGGFSQGCAMSLCYGLSSNKLLGGIIGFSGQLFQTFSFKNKDQIQMLVYHGGQDDCINYKQAKALYDKYLKSSPTFDFRFIPDLFHSVTTPQLTQSCEWILEQLKLANITQ